jgi:hypothetical protein
VLVLAEALANQSPQAITPYRGAKHAHAHGHAKTRSRPVARAIGDAKEVIPAPPSSLIDTVEIRSGTDPLSGAERQTPDRHSVRVARAYGISRLRPFERRRARTSRPPLLAMRARKPWVRLRWILLG